MAIEAELRSTVLVVDDDEDLRALVTTLLDGEGHTVHQAPNVADALTFLDRRPVDLVLTDLMMPGDDGLVLLRRVRERWPSIPVVMMTAHGTVATAVEAMKAGAADFIVKPLDEDEVRYAVTKGLSTSAFDAAQPADTLGPGDMIGQSSAMKACYELVRKAARGEATVLVRGESGTGKELAARAIHAESQRSAGPFVKVHCGALPDNLLESELFGYEKGAFTGAVQHKPGRVDLASGGTLFLDEIGDVTPALQVKLLRLLQDKAYERLGGTKTLAADLRFVAATHRDLEAMVADGTFREDLFYRLNVVPLVMPPLRERRDDIPLLATRWFDELKVTHGVPDLRLGLGVIDRLREAAWPGNVRQLSNVVERLVVLSDGKEVRLADVEREVACNTPKSTPAPPLPPDAPLRQRRKSLERQAVVEALEKADNNRTLAARLLGISRRTLYNKLESFGLMDRS